mmetsp:Transcript_31963/g.97564  ORF Transcript_31963/g.97564 Transcript_31963/m.97564 type:complete len:235 (-) Transcript_31963:403-1107(-)
MHPLLLAQLNAAGLDVTGGGSARRSWINLLREVSRTYEQYGVSGQAAGRSSPFSMQDVGKGLPELQEQSLKALVSEVDNSSTAPVEHSRATATLNSSTPASSGDSHSRSEPEVEEPAIIRDVLFANLGGNFFVIKHILSKFVDRAQVTMKSLEQRKREEDWPSLRREAHSLKGASGYVAAAQLNKRALALQLAAEDKKVGKEPEVSIEICLAAVQSEMERVLQSIASILDEANG